MLDSPSGRLDFSEPSPFSLYEVETSGDYSPARGSAPRSASRAVLAPRDQEAATISAALQAAFAAGLRAGGTRRVQRPRARPEQPKYRVIAELLTREQGCMAWEIREATGWTTFSIPRWAEAAGLVLHKVRICGNTFRFFGIPREVAETVDIKVVGPPKAMRLVMTPKGPSAHAARASTG